MSNETINKSSRKKPVKEATATQAIFANVEVEEKQTKAKVNVEKEAGETDWIGAWTAPVSQSKGRAERPKRPVEEIPLHPVAKAFQDEVLQYSDREESVDSTNNLDDDYTPEEAIETLIRVHGYNRLTAENIVNDAIAIEDRSIHDRIKANTKTQYLGIPQSQVFATSTSASTISTSSGTLTTNTINVANGDSEFKKKTPNRRYSTAPPQPNRLEEVQRLYQPIVRDTRTVREIEDDKREKETQRYFKDVTNKLIKAGYEVITPDEREERDRGPVEGEEMIINICELADYLTNQKLTEKYGNFKLEDIESEYALTYEKFVHDITIFKRNKNG